MSIEIPTEAALIPAENFVVLEANQRIGLLIEPGVRVCLEGDLAVSTRRGEVDRHLELLVLLRERRGYPVEFCAQRGYKPVGPVMANHVCVRGD